MVLEFGLVANFKKGPFESDENFAKFQEAGDNLFAAIEASNYTDELWLTFYPTIAAQMGTTSERTPHSSSTIHLKLKV